MNLLIYNEQSVTGIQETPAGITMSLRRQNFLEKMASLKDIRGLMWGTNLHMKGSIAIYPFLRLDLF